ncbi:MAG: dihydroorotase [Flavobacteriales bacterium]
MNLLLRSATIISPGSPHHDTKCDILIKKGRIEKIGDSLNAAKNAKEIKSDNLHISPGWFDMKAHFGEPGEEYKEDIKSGMNAAAKGGFTEVLLMPSTHPPIDTKSGVTHLIKKSDDHVVKIHPTGAITKGLNGNELSEMYDMKLAGAFAFTDDKKPVENTSLMINALLYASNINSFLISNPDDVTLSNNGVMNEGETSTKMGLRGTPAISEEIRMLRDIRLTEYTESKLHFSPISTKEGLKVLKEAKKAGLKVNAAVNAYNLSLDENEMKEYDSNLKVFPPLRSKNTIKALKKGLKEGTIDVIQSDHIPQDTESKKVEFMRAEPGMTSLETLYPLVNTYATDILDTTTIIEKIAINPRKILDLEVPVIKEGETANITAFDPSVKWKYSKDSIESKALNSPFIDEEFDGKVIGVARGERSEFFV